MSNLIDRVNRLNVDLQHLVILKFPRTSENYDLYFEVLEEKLFSKKLKNHPVYDKSIIEHLDPPTKIGTYTHKNYQNVYHEWNNKKGYKHRRKDLPAAIGFYKNGRVHFQSWWKNGNKHRDSTELSENLPARIEWYEDGKLKYQEWWKKGERHREGDLPAYIEWYENGKIEYKEWWKEGIFKRHGWFEDDQ